MLKFLRLFSAFRNLEADRDSQVIVLREALQQETQRAMLLQDRLESAQNERVELWGMVRECVNGERISYQAHINASWQKQGHGVPYPDAPQIPAHAVPQEQNTDPIARRAFPSEAMARQTSRFIHSLVTNEQ
jgi:hypothetical protein